MISLKNITTSHCLNDVTLDIQDGEFIVVLGFTGAGKSTLLNVIAGLTEYKGNVLFNQKDVNLIPTEKRNVGYLFQEVYLFPHLNTFENIAFGLRARGYCNDLINDKVKEVLSLLHISHLSKRYPKNLSGGEKQRIGLARSIIMEPKILLLDEPLSSLDAATSKSIRKELKELQKRLNLTILYVTHNLVEARKLADRIVVLVNGQIRQLGTVQDIFSKQIEDTQDYSFVNLSNKVYDLDYKLFNKNI
ncbi:MAG: ABC transporter ATP-binding protein [Firmicutes bacterium]|nr:ABC transporter ATP-binding protein [Bacillota bacterium]